MNALRPAQGKRKKKTPLVSSFCCQEVPRDRLILRAPGSASDLNSSIISDPVDPPSLMSKALKLHFPFGLIGMRQFTRFELQPAPDSPPFLLLRAEGDESIEFVVLDCMGVVDGYEVVLNDEESEALGIRSPEDAMVLNIVTIHSMDPTFVTVNLAGPLVVNRSTMLGQQIILSGPSPHSTEHILVDQRGGSPS